MHSFFYPFQNNGYVNKSVYNSFFEFNGDKVIGKKIADCFTDDLEVIKYRNELFGELLKSEELCTGLINMRKILKEFYDNFAYVKKVAATTESALRGLLIAKDYINAVKGIEELLKPFSDREIRSLKNIYNSLSEEVNDRDFLMFEKEIAKYEEKINGIKSITIGVNLDAQLRPKEAGLISVNTESFKSGHIIDRFFRLEFKKDEYCCVAPLTTMSEGGYTDRLKLDEAINNALDSVIKSSVARTLKDTVRIIEKKMSVYSLLPDELEMITGVIKYINEAKENGLPLCIAEINGNGNWEIERFYDPLLWKKKVKAVTNDIVIGKDTKGVILTGPNSGGKTALLRALGLINLFSMLGIPVPAEKAVLGYIPKNVAVAFSPDNATQSKGRLEQECAGLGEIFKNCERESVIFLDEPFTTTSPKEGAELLEEYTEKFLSKEKTTVFIATHLLDFAEKALEKDGMLCCKLGRDSQRYKLTVGSVSESSNAKSISEKYW